MIGNTNERNWQVIRDDLEVQQTRIVKAIRDYPSPITGCDAQFDHLLEQRDGISRELRRLENARLAGGAAESDSADFIASSTWTAT